MSIVTVVGNPRPGLRTLGVAEALATAAEASVLVVATGALAAA